MMGAPGIQPEFISQDIKKDPLSDEIRNNLNDVVGTTQEVLQEALVEVQQLLKDPNASLEQRQQVAEKIERLTKGAQKATQSVESYRQAELFEREIVDVALDENNGPQEVIHKGQAFLDAAATHYNNSRQALLEAGEAVAPEMRRKDKATQTSFWQKVANAALGIEVMVQRVASLPERLAEQIVVGTEKRIDAVNQTFARWAEQTQESYTQLRNEAQELAGTIVDHTATTAEIVKNRAQSVGGAVMDQAEVLDNKVGQFVHEKITTPIFNFLTEKAIPALKSVSKSLYDGLSDQVRQTSSDYQSVLQRRKNERAGAADFEVEVTPSSLGMK